MNRRQAQTAAVAWIVLLLISGCSSSTSPSPANAIPIVNTVAEALAVATARNFEEEKTILKDGHISYEEYASSVEKANRCLTKNGYTLGKVMLDPVSGTQLYYGGTYAGPKGSYDDVAVSMCGDRLSIIEVPYLASTPQKMDPTLLAAVGQCLDDRGVSHTGNETKLEDFFTAGENTDAILASPIVACVKEKAMALFPDLPGIGIGF